MTDEERTDRERVGTDRERVGTDVELHSLDTETEEPTDEELTESAEDEVEAHKVSPKTSSF